jgi:hypothetical protein
MTTREIPIGGSWERECEYLREEFLRAHEQDCREKRALEKRAKLAEEQLANALHRLDAAYKRRDELVDEVLRLEARAWSDGGGA